MATLFRKQTVNSFFQHFLAIAYRPNHLAWLIGGLLLPLLGPLAKPASALNAGAVSITMTTDPLLVSDSNSCITAGPRAAYVGFNITNTSGNTLTNLQANLGGFVTGFSLGGGQAATQYVGTLAPGASRTVYSFISYPCHTSTPKSNTLTVTVSDANAGVVTGTGTVTSNSSISANAGGLISSSTLGPGAVVGQTILYDVTYSFGNASNGDNFNLQPAGNTSFNARCFQLVNSEITASNVTAIPVGTKNKLYYTATTNQGGSGNTVSVRYSLIYLCSGVNTTTTPYAAQTSGATNMKYTGNYSGTTATGASTSTSFPSATNPFTITKSASSTSLPTGGTVTYTVTITNNSGFDSIIDRITDVLPAGVTYGGLATGSDVTAANSSSLPISGATGTLNWVGIPNTTYKVSAGGSVKLVYTATVTGNPGSYTNSVTATSGQSTTSPATATVNVGSADIVTTKTGPASVLAGGNITYTIATTNNGPSAATNVVIKDTLPAGVTFVSASDSGIVANGIVTWAAIANLASGASVTRTVTVTAPTTGSSILNKASSTSNTLDPNTANNDGSLTTAQVSTTITPSADLSINKTDGQTTATPGSSITYTISVTNNGPNTVNSLTVTDVVPSTIIDPTFTASTGTYNSSTGIWTGLNLASGQSVTLTLKGTIDARATGNLTNTATVAAPSGVTDSNTSNNSSSDTNTLVPVADLSLTKTASSTNVAVGQDVTFTVIVNNTGLSIATGVKVTDLLPAGLKLGSAIPSQGTYDINTGIWTVGSVDSGSNATLQVNASLLSNNPVTNTAEVTAANQFDPDSTPNNNIATEDDQASVTIGNATVKLLLVKRITAIVPNNGTNTINVVDDPGTTDDNSSNWSVGYLKGVINGNTIKPGDTVEYTIYFLSNGGLGAQKVNICDLVPANTTFMTNAYGNGSGIAQATGSAAAVNLTNIADTDGGQYIDANASLPTGVSCSAANTNGAVIVNVGNVPNATSAGTPGNSYGFIRFRVRVN